jgi:hypothetical protein
MTSTDPTTFAEAAGLGTYIELGGRKLMLTPLLPEDFALAKEYIKSKTPNPLEEMRQQIQGLPEAVQVKLAEKAYEAYERWGSITTIQGKDWANSVDGVAFFLHRSISKVHAEVTHDWVIQQMAEASLKKLREMMAKIDQASGLANPPHEPSSSPKRVVRNRQKRRR